MRARQRDDTGFAHASLRRGLAGAGAHEIGQTGHISIVAQHQPVRGFIGQHVLAEARGEFGQALHDLAVAHLRCRGEPGSGAHEIKMNALQHAALFRVQLERAALFVQRVDARKQCGIGVDRVVVRCQARRHVALHGLQSRRGLAGRQVVKQRGNSIEQPATAVQRGNRVLETRGLRRPADARDIGQVLGERRVERRCKVRCLNVLERRQPMRRGPGLQQRIGGRQRHASPCVELDGC